MIWLITPEERYIPSYWETVNAVVAEKKYLAAAEAFEYESTMAFVREAMNLEVPQIFAVDDDIDLCVGWCDAVEKEPGVGYLGMGLREEYREQGIGTRMIKEILERSVRKGYRKMVLDVRASNKRAIHVYEKLGFQMVAVQDASFVVNGQVVGEEVVQMELIL